MDLDGFFLVEDMTAAPAAEPAPDPDPDPGDGEQLALIAVSTYRGPRNRRGVRNTAALDEFGNVAI